jgi:hypothetical protein
MASEKQAPDPPQALPIRDGTSTVGEKIQQIVEEMEANTTLKELDLYGAETGDE